MISIFCLSHGNIFVVLISKRVFASQYSYYFSSGIEKSRESQTPAIAVSNLNSSYRENLKSAGADFWVNAFETHLLLQCFNTIIQYKVIC